MSQLPLPGGPNPLRSTLEEGRPGVGVLVSMPSVHMVQVLIQAGFDWLFIDMEHGPIGLESAHAMIAATRGSATAPLVRVPWNVPWLVKPVLDAGAMGIIFPMVRSPEEAARAVASVRYPPRGERGFGPFYAAPRFGLEMAEYPDVADREAMVVLLVEHREAVEGIGAIGAVEGVDAFVIAPFDLAMSYGYRDGPEHPEVQEAIRRVEDALLPGPVPVGGLAGEPALANDMVARGYRLILTGFDTALVRRAADPLLAGIDRTPRPREIRR